MPTQTTITPERVGKMALKVATEAVYVVAGLADVVAGTVQDVIANQKRQLSDRRSTGTDNRVRGFVREVPDQLKGFADEVVGAYKDLSSRGRHVMEDGFANTAHRPGKDDSAADQPTGYQQPPTP